MKLYEVITTADGKPAVRFQDGYGFVYRPNQNATHGFSEDRWWKIGDPEVMATLRARRTQSVRAMMKYMGHV